MGILNWETWNVSPLAPGCARRTGHCLQCIYPKKRNGVCLSADPVSDWRSLLDDFRTWCMEELPRNGLPGLEILRMDAALSP